MVGDNEDTTSRPNTGDLNGGAYGLGEDYVLVGQVLDKVTKAAAQMKLNDSVADIVELGDFRLSCQKRQIESLQMGLQAADQRIASLHELNICLEQEVAMINTAIIVPAYKKKFYTLPSSVRTIDLP